MNLAEFRSLADPAGLDEALQALWHDAQGDWEWAHTLTQRADSPAGDWVHAYLHRKEGDLGNAAYWYGRAGQPEVGSEVSLEQEWDTIVQALLTDAG